MVTRFDPFFSDLIGEQYVNSEPGRFEWSRGHLKKENGEYYMFSLRTETTVLESKAVHQYLIDNVTGKMYIAQSPTDIGPNFFFAAVITPINLFISLTFHAAKLALVSIRVAYQVFCDVYPRLNEKEITPLLRESFERHLKEQKEEMITTLEEMVQSVKYAAGMELAAIYGAVYYNDPEVSWKMQTIFAELERQWNHEVDYQHTPFSHSMRFKKLIQGGRSYEESYDLVATDDMVPTAFYILQCCQPRHADRVEEFGERYSSYEAMQDAIRQEAQRHGNQNQV